MRSRSRFDFTFGALAVNTFVLQGSRIDASRLNGSDLRKINHTAVWTSGTNGQGPQLYGLSVGLSIAQLKEWFEADPQSRADTEELEKSQRHSIILGSLGDSVASGAGAQFPVWKRAKWPGWDILEGQLLSAWVMNAGSVTMTTGKLSTIVMEFLGDWKND